ncbi:MAG: hypothetical protein CVU25_03775, partial [Betaproteobacteria bacterium HGW-Betaproteobacteria-19]
MKTIISSVVCVALVSGCAGMNETQRDTGTGAANGAVAGAVLGAATSG